MKPIATVKYLLLLLLNFCSSTLQTSEAQNSKPKNYTLQAIWESSGITLLQIETWKNSAGFTRFCYWKPYPQPLLTAKSSNLQNTKTTKTQHFSDQFLGVIILHQFSKFSVRHLLTPVLNLQATFHNCFRTEWIVETLRLLESIDFSILYIALYKKLRATPQNPENHCAVRSVKDLSRDNKEFDSQGIEWHYQGSLLRMPLKLNYISDKTEFKMVTNLLSRAASKFPTACECTGEKSSQIFQRNVLSSGPLSYLNYYWLQWILGRCSLFTPKLNILNNVW